MPSSRWSVATPDGTAVWDGALSSSPAVVAKVELELGRRSRIEAMPLCPSFPSSITDEYAVLAALVAVYGDIESDSAPLDVVVPPIPEDAVS